MSKKKNGRDSVSDTAPPDADSEAPSAEEQNEAKVRVRKVLPPDGSNAILNRYVKVGEEFDVTPQDAEGLLLHGEFEAVK